MDKDFPIDLTQTDLATRIHPMPSAKAPSSIVVLLRFDSHDALALDGSPKAQAVLNKKIESYDEKADAGTAAGEALNRVKAGHPEVLSGDSDLAQLVVKNGFFIDPRSRRYTSARLLGLNGTKDKALVEVYVNRGALAEEWYHVVICKSEPSWKFFSITQIAVS